MRVLASGSIFFESGRVDLLGKFWFPGHFENKIQKNSFFRTVNQLKKTSDCIKIDPPGPGQNLEKSQKSWKKSSQILVLKKVEKIGQNFGPFLRFFCCLGFFFAIRFFISKKQVFSAGASPGAPLRGALGRAPPPFSRVEILKKFTGKSVPENYTLFLGENIFWGYFTYQNALICV